MSKPMIRHCRNCKWGECKQYDTGVYCMVKYKRIAECNQRIEAMMCWHYKKNEPKN